jgi:uncharacterized damage-inducible protein DinB
MNAPVSSTQNAPEEGTADLRYPVGHYRPPADIGERERFAWIAEVEVLPDTLRTAVDGLSEDQLDTPYRPGGWTVRQVVHHLPDSHLNSYTRFRLALTEQNPLIKPYAEAAWAELPDAKAAPIEPSLSLLDGLHRRWAMLLRALSDADFRRTFQHPERGQIALDWTLGLYAWHSRHHVAQILSLRKRNGW